MKISAHCVVKNEDQWIWYAIMSVLDYVDEICVVDTGSTDNTSKVISTISSPKLKLSFQTASGPEEITDIRQKLLQTTTSDWVLMLDGDEVWPRSAIESSISAINHANSSLDFLISHSKNFVGDVYHYQPESAGKYKFGIYKGHLNMRWFNAKTPGIHFEGQINSEWLADDANIPLDKKVPFRGVYISEPYLHYTHLVRSSKSSDQLFRTRKYKHEIGIHVAKNYVYPLCFYSARPDFIPSPWQAADRYYWLQSTWQTPLRYLKRIILQ